MKATVKKLLKMELLLTVLLLITSLTIATLIYRGVKSGTLVKGYSVAENYRLSSLQIFTARIRGSAVYMSNGLALSAAHVCADFTDQSMFATDFYGNHLEITEFETSIDTDICVMKLKLKDELPSRTLAEKDTFLFGQQVIMPGFQGGEQYSIFIQKVIGMLTITVNYEQRVTNLTDMYTAPGGSGGGVFNNKGEVVGIVSASSQQTNVTAIITLVDIYKFLKQSPIGNILVK